MFAGLEMHDEKHQMGRRDDERPSIRSMLISLLAAGAATSGFVALAHGMWLCAAVEEARLRELALVQMVRCAFEEHGWSTAGTLPGAFHVAFDLHAPWSGLSFVAQAVGLGCVAALGLALAASPLVLGLYVLRTRLPTSVIRWSSVVALPLTATALSLVPGIWMWAGERVAHELLQAQIIDQILVYACLAWAALIAVFGRVAAARRLARLQVSVATILCLATIVVAPLATWAAGRPAGRPVPRPGLPNILLVSIDSLRPDHLGCYGYHRDTSPHLDALAAQGVRFEIVVAPSPWTLPSHITMLSGLPPVRHGVIDNGMRASGDTVFLAEVLRATGYATAGFVAGPYLDAAFGFSQGFDHYDDHTLPAASNQGSHRGSTSAASVALLTRWLDRHGSSTDARPFFVFLHMWDVHYDYTPPAPYDRAFDPDYRGSISPHDFETGDHVHPGMDPRDLAHIIALYDGEIAYVDHHLGVLFDTLAARGLLDDTIVIVSADHGEEFFEHGRKGHQKALYDESLLVPLILRYPRRLPAGVVVPTQVRVMDIPRTILSLANIEPPAQLGGAASAFFASRDLSPLALGREIPEAAPPAVSELFGRLASIRTETAKWISRPQELYDLSADPRETENLAGTRPALQDDLRRRLHRWQEGWKVRGPLARPTSVPADVTQRLRTLGYVE